MTRTHKIIGIFFGVFSSLLPVQAYDIPGFSPDQVVEYKQTVDNNGNPVTLDLHVFTPPSHQASHQRPAIVFFFGGGWVSGSASHFHPQCEYLASRGMVAISAEYRVKNLHGTTPQECVMDGKSAIRYIREHAAELGVDPNRIAAGGGSAGGHVAAAAGTLTAYEEPGENLAISSKPDALVIYNGVVDNGPGGYGYTTVQAYWQDISPLYNIQNTSVVPPPTVFFLGTSDALIPVATGQAYQAATEANGARCDLHLYEGQPHSFFNYDVPDDSSGPFYGYRDTVFKTDAFLVSLGYLSDPQYPVADVSGWVTLTGNAGFSGGSAGTASPLTTDADDDAIAASFTPVTLTDGKFVRLTGAVTFNAPLSTDSFRFGLFGGANPVAAGVGTGYTGVWASAPATTATSIAAGDGSGSHPFDDAAATIIGPMPAASITLASDTALEFSMTIARNGDQLDIAVDLANGATYRTSQNLINLTSTDYTFDRVAFLMSDSLNATQASFSNVQITSGPVPIDSVPETPPAGTGLITFVDAAGGVSGNTVNTGNSSATDWYQGTSKNDTQWTERSTFGTGGTIYESLMATDNADPSGLPQLKTTITGLDAGQAYDIWVFFIDNTGDNAAPLQNWSIGADLTTIVDTTYWSAVQPLAPHNAATPAVGANGSGTITSTGVVEASTLDFVSDPTFTESSGTGERRLYGVNIGQASGSATADVYIQQLIETNSGDSRTWYDGVGYQPVTESPITPSYTRLLGVDFNRDDELGSPSQSGYWVISGSAANQAANAPSYSMTMGNHQLTVSQPDGTNFEFRGANGETSRAIPGGETSRSFLVSDFIASRDGEIDIQITGLSAGNYRFRSWHLDPFTSSTLGFAQGSTNTTPNLIEAQVGGITLAATEPTALGGAGLDTTFINDAQIPMMEFTLIHDGSSPLTIRLRAIDTNGSERFLLLNGFDLSQETL